MRNIYFIAGALAAILLSGCASSRSLYYWGSYEGQVYSMYNDPGEAPAERQIEMMEADIEKARSKGKPLPPGFRAHLGMLYYQTGRFDLARQSFESEKSSFPESTVLMDRFIKRLEGGDA